MLSPIYISAQSVSETFVNMPDTILPYLAIQQRKDLVELKRMEPDSTAIINSGLGKIELTRLTDSIISLCLSEHNSFELGIISPDTLYIIKTYGASYRRASARCIAAHGRNSALSISLIPFLRISRIHASFH